MLVQFMQKCSKAPKAKVQIILERQKCTENNEMRCSERVSAQAIPQDQKPLCALAQKSVRKRQT